ncbi:hypothetical protein SAMN04488024_1221, partial [Pedobacter soli]
GIHGKTGRIDENQAAYCSLETMEEYNGQSEESDEGGRSEIKGLSAGQYPQGILQDCKQPDTTYDT